MAYTRLRKLLVDSIDPNFPRSRTPEEVADRVLGAQPAAMFVDIAGLADEGGRPLLQPHELGAFQAKRQEAGL